MFRKKNRKNDSSVEVNFIRNSVKDYTDPNCLVCESSISNFINTQGIIMSCRATGGPNCISVHNTEKCKKLYKVSYSKLRELYKQQL